MNIEIVTPTPYTRPADGHDICESCNSLEPVHTEYPMDDGSRVVPLCEQCDKFEEEEQVVWPW